MQKVATVGCCVEARVEVQENSLSPQKHMIRGAGKFTVLIYVHSGIDATEKDLSRY